MDAVVYVHGKGGSSAEAAYFETRFPGCAVIGLDYKSETPWEAAAEFRAAFTQLKTEYERLTLIANSVGAYFCLCAGADAWVEKAYFISPVTDMEGLIRGMMARENVTQEALEAKGELRTASGETLSWAYLTYVRAHPIVWRKPAAVLYGRNDALLPFSAVSAFAAACGASLTVMETAGHWFHTPGELRFLDRWIAREETRVRPLAEAETPAALALAWRVFTEYESPVYPPEGTEEFRKSIHDPAYLKGIVYYGAFYGERLAGVLGVRKEKRHICFFFVEGAYHRRGIGTLLFRRMLADFPGQPLTLNAAPYGLPFYKKLGFTQTEAEQTVNGIRFTPMRYQGE